MASISPIKIEIRSRIVRTRERDWLDRVADRALAICGGALTVLGMLSGVILHEYAHATFLFAFVLLMRSYFPSPEQTNG